jgi:pyrimidine operon attenuation protein/uracil phosphoribosyltransferase
MSVIDAEVLYRALLEQIRSAYLTPQGSAFGLPHGPVLAGIYSGGAWLAQRLAKDLDAPAFGVVNITLHRDDYAQRGLHIQTSSTSLPFDVNHRRIVLIDDVLYTGRSVRAALNELYDYGRPAAVELAVLADRGGREMPVAARFTGGVVEADEGITLVLARSSDGRFTFHTEPAHP